MMQLCFFGNHLCFWVDSYDVHVDITTRSKGPWWHKQKNKDDHDAKYLILMYSTEEVNKIYGQEAI